jgi:hypothetical protein
MAAIYMNSALYGVAASVRACVAAVPASIEAAVVAPLSTPVPVPAAVPLPPLFEPVLVVPAGGVPIPTLGPVVPGPRFLIMPVPLIGLGGGRSRLPSSSAHAQVAAVWSAITSGNAQRSVGQRRCSGLPAVNWVKEGIVMASSAPALAA